MTAQVDMFASVEEAVDSHDCWRTPRALWDRLNAQFHFVCDLASSDDNALCANHLTANDDALALDWPLNGWCWLNAPFSQLPEFFAKVHEQVVRGVRLVAAVPGHRHEQDWFHKHVVGVATSIAVPLGRVNYGAPPGVASSTVSFPSMILIYGARPPVQTRALTLEGMLR